MRHVPWSKLRKDENDNVLGLLPQAFQLRPQETSLSLNWLEFFEGNHSARTEKAVRELRKVKHIGQRSVFAIGKVGGVKEICKQNGREIKIVYAPTTGIPSHAEIRNLPRDDLVTLDAIATQGFLECVYNSDIVSDIVEE